MLYLPSMHIGSARPVTHKSDNAMLKRNSFPTFRNFLLIQKQPMMMKFPHMPTVRAQNGHCYVWYCMGWLAF